MNIKTFTAHYFNISSKAFRPAGKLTVKEFLEKHKITEVFEDCKSGIVFTLEDDSKVKVRCHKAVDIVKGEDFA